MTKYQLDDYVNEVIIANMALFSKITAGYSSQLDEIDQRQRSATLPGTRLDDVDRRQRSATMPVPHGPGASRHYAYESDEYMRTHHRGDYMSHRTGSSVHSFDDSIGVS